MTDDTKSVNGDSIESLTQQFLEGSYADDDTARAVPMASADAEEVIKSQLVEKTGRHFLDSGGAYGRHWEDNQDNPPWERAAKDVQDGYVVTNVFHHMEQNLQRDRSCVALEAALYAFSYTDANERTGWNTCSKEFADSVLAGDLDRVILVDDLGLPPQLAEEVLGVQAEVRDHATGHRNPRLGSSEPQPNMGFNTYNNEFHTLSQCLQGVVYGGPYGPYVTLQVHGGRDVRGGYTAPRVYKPWDGVVPNELSFYCDRCGWTELESCLAWGDENDLIFQPTLDEAELDDMGLLDADGAAEAVEQAANDDYTDGAVFHRCEDGGLGYVQF